MNALRNLSLMAAFALVTAGSSAQDAEPRPETPPPEEAAPRPAPSDDVFIPTEEIAADEEVTFPVDI